MCQQQEEVHAEMDPVVHAVNVIIFLTYHRGWIGPLFGPEERKQRQEWKSLESHFFVRLLVVVHKKFWKVQVKIACPSQGIVCWKFSLFHLHQRISPLWIPRRQGAPHRPQWVLHCSPWRLAAKRISPSHPIGRRVIRSGGRRQSRTCASSTSRRIWQPFSRN